MIRPAVRGVVITALVTAIALLPTSAQAEGTDKDNDIERIELTGVQADAPPTRMAVGNSWVAQLHLYAKKTTKATKAPKTKKTAKTAKTAKAEKAEKATKQARTTWWQYAGDGESDCAEIRVSGDRVTTQCTRVLRLKRGTLTLSDMITYRPQERVTAKTAIIGGTGHYRSAYGDGYITLDGRYVHFELNVDE